jgi:hypothetical protein
MLVVNRSLRAGSKKLTSERIHMIRNCLFLVALLSLALAGGCAKGGNGMGSGITVSIGSGFPAAIYPGQSVTFTATVTGTTNMAVTWSVSGSGCTGTGNPCGTIDKNSGAYVAPAAPPNPANITITATSAADPTATGTATVKLVLVAVVVTPTTIAVSSGLEQQFTAIAVPDDAPQTFTWTCTPSSACAGFVPGPNNQGLAAYTAPSSPQTGIQVTATSTVSQATPGSGTSKVSVVASRLASISTYAFQFAGYESGQPVAVTGSITTGANGAITGGVEAVLPAPVGGNPLTVTSGSFTQSPGSINSNNLGTLTLHLSDGSTNQYTAVLSSSGNIQMIDSLGKTGSGVMQKAAPGQFNGTAQTFAFGFTGVDAANGRVGYAGILTTDGAGTITSGMLDSNDNGTATTGVCAAPPCSFTGTYTMDPDSLRWHMTLNTATTLHFDFVIGGGVAQSKTAPNSLTLYAISTDPVATNPAVSGPMVYQVSGITYNNAAFVGSSVSALTGLNANVSLTLGSTDGTSGGTGGTGGFTGSFDQNSNGTILSVSSFGYTYIASTGNTGRYVFQMLGNPAANPAVPPIPFVLYASGVNRGFLLDQSSPEVITGAMYPQPAKASYTNTEMPGVYAAATTSNSNTNVVQPPVVVQNLLLTSPGGGVFNVSGAQNPGNQAITGRYNLGGLGSGTGTITLTAPPPPSVATNVIYAIDFDVTNSVVLDFMMMGTTSGTPSAIVFAQQ